MSDLPFGTNIVALTNYQLGSDDLRVLAHPLALRHSRLELWGPSHRETLPGWK
jgi:hypothetical protein